MMNTNPQENALIDSIKKEAHEEASKILEDARRYAEDRKKSTDEQIARIRKDNQEREGQQVNAIAREAEQKIASLEQKQLLALKSKVIDLVLERVREKFGALVLQPEFKETLIEWTVEAALGLAEQDPILHVTTSCNHLVNAAFLDEAARRYKELAGKDVVFTLAPEKISTGCGVVLEAKNGRTAYNNLLENRLDRYQAMIQAIVLKDIFDE